MLSAKIEINHELMESMDERELNAIILSDVDLEFRGCSKKERIKIIDFFEKLFIDSTEI